VRYLGQKSLYSKT